MPNCDICGEWQPSRVARCSTGHEMPVVTAEDYAGIERRIEKPLRPSTPRVNIEDLRAQIVDAVAGNRAALQDLAYDIAANWPIMDTEFTFDEIIEFRRLPRGKTRADPRSWVAQVLAGTRPLRRPLRAAAVMDVVDPAGRRGYLVALQHADFSTLFLELGGVFATREAAEDRLALYGFRSVEEFDRWTGLRTRVRRFPVVEATS